MDVLVRNKLFWAILLIALFIRIAAGFWWQSRMPEDQRFFFGDSDSYEVLAQSIAQDKPYQYGTAQLFRTPGYPLALAPFYWIESEPPVICLRIGNAVWGTLAVMLAGMLAARLFNERAGLWAALLVALYPGAIAMSVFVLAESVFCPLMLLQLILWHQALTSSISKHHWICAALAGAVFAAAVLVRPSWLLFPGFVAPLGLLFYADRIRQVKVLAVMMVAAVVVFLP
ncbi:MAG: phospholipid carrier-dependent glycosyltransferase [Pirellulales bacterium]